MLDMSMFLSPEVLRQRYELYAQMRQFQPVLQVPDQRIWLIFGYDDVRNILSDYTIFSSDFGRSAHSTEAGQTRRHSGTTLITSDPPVHRKLRDLVTRAFTPKAVEAQEPRIIAITNDLIDQVIESGHIDLINDLAAPLPVIVIAEMLGIPPEDRAQFKRWSDLVVASADNFFTDFSVPESRQRAAEQQRASWDLAEYSRKIIRQRRAKPQNDLISALIAAELDGQRLTEQDLLSFVTLLLIAGNITTTNLIGNGILTLLEHPDQLASLKADMSLLPSAIEEMLRYSSPVQSVFRNVTQETTVGGQTLRKGDIVLTWIGSANRDETRFPAADTFDITRQPNPHIAFGFGIHYCLGAPLARLEGRLAIPAILNRLQNLERVNNDPLPLAEGILINGVTSLPLRFTPAPRQSTAPRSTT